MSPYVHAAGPQRYSAWERGNIIIQKINNRGADKDSGIITHIKNSAERANTEGDMTGSAGPPALDMILPKKMSLDFPAMCINTGVH